MMMNKEFSNSSKEIFLEIALPSVNPFTNLIILNLKCKFEQREIQNCCAYQ